ncbi:MAG: hypothetical protein QOK43_2883 [Acidimicrobiaceae bacterium]|nr:hypothetical protein [Acidimicrobiaceae bacterium]
MSLHQSPFDALESSFRLLCEPPTNIAINGAEVGWPLPPRLVPLDELRGRLLHPATPFEVRDRVMLVLARKAKSSGGCWTVALAGLLLPGLRASIGPLTRLHPREAADIEAETLAELMRVLAAFDHDDRVAARLVWRAARHTRERTARELTQAAKREPTPLPAAPHRPWGHPDFVLAEAVAAGVITAAEAELIGDTRIDGRSLCAWAKANGIPDGAARMRRMRAERRLVEWIVKKSA